MIYSNDESDKALRTKNHFIEVYVQPIVVSLILSALFFLSAKTFMIGSTDHVMGYYLAVFAGIIVYARNQGRWLKMPDGTWYNVKGIRPPHVFSANEPAEYDEEYFVSKKDKIVLVAMGLFSLAAGIFFGVKDVRGVFLPIFLIGSGSVAIYLGIKAFQDKGPALKLASQGLWTAKLGFVDWKDIEKAEVVEEKGRSTQTILDIYLKGTVFSEANEPDQRLNISGFLNKENVELHVETYIFKYKESGNPKE